MEYFYIKVLLKFGKIQKAIAVADQMMGEGEPNYEKLYGLRGVFLEAYNSDATAAAIRILEYLNTNASGEILEGATDILAILHNRSYQYEQADRLLAAEFMQKYQNIIARRIFIAIDQGKLEKGWALLEAGKALADYNPDIITAEAELFYFDGQWEKVRAVYQDYVNRYPKLVASHYLLGKYYYEVEDDYLLAKVSLEKAIELLRKDSYYPNYIRFLTTEYLLIDLQIKYVQVLRKLGEGNRVRKFLKRFSTRQLRQNLKYAQLYNSKEWEKAKILVKKVSAGWREDLKWRNYLSSLGEILVMQGEYGEAEECLLEAIAIGEAVWMPDIQEYMLIAICRNPQIDALPTGDDFLDRAYYWNPAKAYTELIDLLFRLERYSQVIQLCKEYAGVRNDLLVTLDYQAESYYALGQTDLAIENFSRLVDFQPRNFKVLGKLHILYQRAGNDRMAKEMLDRINALEGLSEEIRQQVISE